MLWIALLTLSLFVIFLISYLRDPRKIINGFLFNSFILAFLVTCLMYTFQTDTTQWSAWIIFPIVAILILIPFAFVVLIVGLFLNARTLMRREGRKLANSLTLLLGLGMLFLLVVRMLDLSQLVSNNLQPLFGGAGLITMYFFLHMFNFLTAYTLYQFNRPKRDQNFVIVLGSGLINNKVPPLLANRINKAVAFYQKQKKVTAPPKIILSGGQGPDEERPEAEAMQEYAIQQGIPAEDTIQENQSVNTYENMVFSKKILDDRKPDGDYHSIFTTNNFHLFRAGIYARKAGLNSQGIGAKTAFYYWPNAMVREYIAIVVLQRKRHLAVVGSILFISICLSIINWFFVY
ncbi:YdcF family protein [Gracilibacillus phocaeensis]|uniref:YdcF family protein n=1 Tax=Gracilibacillus phocaeensis TaxID=2042304 RepID=UPI001A924AF9|nr:YdcF family protein [Gracilibacillus phocaeensis]